MAPQLQQCGAPTWWPRAGRPAQPALSCQRCWLTSPLREVLEPTSYLGRWAATGAPRGLLNGAVPCWPLNYSGVVRPQWSRGGGLIVHPADPLTTAVWCATWAPGPLILHPLAAPQVQSCGAPAWSQGGPHSVPWRPLCYSRVVRQSGPRWPCVVYPGGPLTTAASRAHLRSGEPL